MRIFRYPLKVNVGLDFDIIIYPSLLVSSLVAITEVFILENYLIHIVVGISLLNDGTPVEEKISRYLDIIGRLSMCLM